MNDVSLYKQLNNMIMERYNKDIDFTKVNDKTWVKDDIPYPNPNVISYTKLFKKHLTIPVTLWFTENELDTASYTVRAGANSDYSHTGCFYPQKGLTVEDMQNILDEKHKNKKLIY